jgi:hypothetical protein
MSLNIINKANEQLDFLCELISSNSLVPICTKLTDSQKNTNIEIMGEHPLKIHCAIYADNEIRFSYFKAKTRIQMRLVINELDAKLFGKEEFFKHLSSVLKAH